jgi:hypothetical protein
MRKVTFLLFLVLSCLALAGMQTTCSVRANFLNEPEKISVILLSPENKTYAPDNLRLTFRVSHWVNYNIETWLTLDNQAPVQLFLSNYLGSLGASAYDSNITGLEDGSHIIRIRSSSGEDYNEAQVYFTVDSAPPTISSISVENKTYAKTDLALNYTISEKVSWIACCLDNQANVSFNGYITLANLTNGMHSLIIYANDTAGNMGASETISFTVAVPEPFPVVPIAVASIASVSIVGAGLLVYFKKRKR